jgi:hypothetical protein
MSSLRRCFPFARFGVTSFPRAVSRAVRSFVLRARPVAMQHDATHYAPQPLSMEKQHHLHIPTPLNGAFPETFVTLGVSTDMGASQCFPCAKRNFDAVETPL